MTNVSENLKRLRLARGLTLYQISKDTGIPCSTLMRIERGEHKKPRLVNIQTLADYFNVDIPDIDPSYSADARANTATKSLNRKVLLVEPGQLAIEGFNKNIEIGSTLLPAPAFKDINANDVVAIMAKGSANAPAIQDGDILYILPTTEETAIRNGSYVLAIPKEKTERIGEPVIRKYIAGDNQQNWLETAPDWVGSKVMECGKILGVVVALARRL